MTADDISALVLNGRRAEWEALAGNPHLDDGILVNMMARQEAFKGLNISYYRSTLRTLAQNPRMVKPYDDTYLDGWAEHSYEGVFRAAWGLAAVLPTEQEWASVLWALLATQSLQIVWTIYWT